MTDLVAGVLFLAPGFLALKVFYLLGAQRRRSQWEWTTWSVIASLPISGAASVLRDRIPTPSATPDPWQIALGLLIGVALGGLLAGVWQLVRGSEKRRAKVLRRAFGSSAWDEALEDAERNNRQIELVLDDGNRYLGRIRYGDRDDNEADGWVYLAYPETYDDGTKKFRLAKGTHGYLVHRDHIKRVRVLLRKNEPDEIAQETSPASADFKPDAVAGSPAMAEKDATS